MNISDSEVKDIDIHDSVNFSIQKFNHLIYMSFYGSNWGYFSISHHQHMHLYEKAQPFITHSL